MSSDTPRTDTFVASAPLVTITQDGVLTTAHSVRAFMVASSEFARTLERELSAARKALRIISGEEQCVDNLLSDKEVARAALTMGPT